MSPHMSVQLVRFHLFLTFWTLHRLVFPMGRRLRFDIGSATESLVLLYLAIFNVLLVGEHMTAQVVNTRLFPTFWTLRRLVFPMAGDMFSCSLHISVLSGADKIKRNLRCKRITEESA